MKILSNKRYNEMLENYNDVCMELQTVKREKKVLGEMLNEKIDILKNDNAILEKSYKETKVEIEKIKEKKAKEQEKLTNELKKQIEITNLLERKCEDLKSNVRKVCVCKTDKKSTDKEKVDKTKVEIEKKEKKSKIKLTKKGVENAK